MTIKKLKFEIWKNEKFTQIFFFPTQFDLLNNMVPTVHGHRPFLHKLTKNFKNLNFVKNTNFNLLLLISVY